MRSNGVNILTALLQSVQCECFVDSREYSDYERHPQKNDAVLDPRTVMRGLFVIRLCQSVLARIPEVISLIQRLFQCIISRALSKVQYC